jgi:hypothetical protein
MPEVENVLEKKFINKPSGTLLNNKEFVIQNGR